MKRVGLLLALALIAATAIAAEDNLPSSINSPPTQDSSGLVPSSMDAPAPTTKEDKVPSSLNGDHTEEPKLPSSME